MEKPRTGDATGPLRFQGGTGDGREHRHRNLSSCGAFNIKVGGVGFGRRPIPLTLQEQVLCSPSIQKRVSIASC
jgi:hypothetical protein